MAKLQWIFTTLVSLILLSTANLAQATESVEEEEEGTGFHASCEGLECFKSEDGDFWTKANFFEAGLKANHLFVLASSKGLEDDTMNTVGLTTSYGWSGDPLGLIVLGPTLRLEGYFARGQADEVDVSDKGLLVSPGFFGGVYFAENWMFTKTILLPISSSGPGVQLEAGVSFIPLSWVAIELSLVGAYVQTALPVRGEDENMLGFGPSLNIIFEPWGDYRVEF